MSTQLTLLPFGPHDECSHAVLGPIEPVGALVEAVEAVQDAHGRDVPLVFYTYLCEDDDEHGLHYGNTQVDAYGARLKHVAVEDLLRLYLEGTVSLPTFEESWNALSAWAYLKYLPEHWRVALYWH